MKQTVFSTRILISAMVLFIACLFSVTAKAVDLPLAAASPLTGVSFEDRPLLLPVQRNFQMAMLTAGSELGRSCGHMEAYGWRMGQEEQGRVNQIFNNTADRLRLLGYDITPHALTSVSKDITLFTADRADKHFMFLWSAGELGLVLNICETSAPISVSDSVRQTNPSVQVFPLPDEDLLPRRSPYRPKGPTSDSREFSPLGVWAGTYVCRQGQTGGTLSIERVNGENFEGTFSFYSTDKNPSVSDGAYEIYGQYDLESKRALINPGKWIKRPKGYYNTVIVGSFDPVHDMFSAYFQGVSGCTSFEAKRDLLAKPVKEIKKASKAKTPKVKKESSKPVKKKTSKVKSKAKTSGVAPAVAPDSSANKPNPSIDAVLSGYDKNAAEGISVAAPPVGK